MQVEECLRRVVNLEIDDAVQWIYLRYSPDMNKNRIQEDEIKPYGLGHWLDASLALPDVVKSTPHAPALMPATAPSSPRLSIAAPSTPAVLTNPESTNGSSLLAYRTANDSDSSDEGKNASTSKSASIAADAHPVSTMASLADGDDLDDDPDRAYVLTKLQLTTMQRRLGLAGKGPKKGGKAKLKLANISKPKTLEEAEIERLEAQLKRIQLLYLFNAKKAEAEFAVERAKLDKLELAERLAGRAQEREKETLNSPDPQELSVDIQGSPPIDGKSQQLGDTYIGTLLEGPPEVATGESHLEESSGPLLNEAGSVVQVREMRLPKTYTGKTPRTLLDDALRRRDKFAKVTYRILARGTRAVRAVATVRWETGKVEQYGMDDEACENQDQAFQYAATLALFALSADGSAHRLLPPVFRDLWDELDAKSRFAAAANYEKQFALLQDLAEARKVSTLEEASFISED